MELGVEAGPEAARLVAELTIASQYDEHGFASTRAFGSLSAQVRVAGFERDFSLDAEGRVAGAATLLGRVPLRFERILVARGLRYAIRGASRVYLGQIERAPPEPDEDWRSQARRAMRRALRLFNGFYRQGYLEARDRLISAIAMETDVSEEAVDIEDHSRRRVLTLHGQTLQSDPLARAVFWQVIVPDHDPSVDYLVRALRDAF